MQESRGCGETHSRPHTLQRWNLGLGVTEVRGNATGYNSPLNLPMDAPPPIQPTVAAESDDALGIRFGTLSL